METKRRIIRDSPRGNAKQISSYEGRSRTKLTPRCFLWLYCFAVNAFYAVDSQTGCSFSSEDWCGYSNVYDGTEGPKWHRQVAPAQQEDRGFSGGRHATLYGRYPMQWPPKSGHFLYTGPTQHDRLAEKSAELRSSVFKVNGSSTCLYFSYHNQVPIRLSPTLVVIRRNANGTSGGAGEFQGGVGLGAADVVLAEFYSLNSERWFEAAVPLPDGEYSVVFSGRNYNSRTMSGGGPVAIANVAVAEGECGGGVPERLRAPGDCGFEAGLEPCGYRYADDSGVRVLRILAESLAPSEQALGGVRRPPADHFLAMTDRFYGIATQGSRARILSPQISIQREGCLLLWYYNSVRATQESNNAFNILKSEKANETLLFRLPVPRSNRDRWYQLSAALPRGDYRLLFEFVYTADFSDNDYVGLDSVEVYNRTCTSVQSAADVCDADTDSSDPICRNGGSCLNAGKKHFRCVCRDDFYGNLCEHAYKCAAGSSDVCQNGGTCLSDGKVSSTCRCPVGFQGRRCENVTSCGSPEQVFRNARLVSFANETYGSTARFECDVGWMKYGDMTGRCSAQGIWEIRGKCLWVNCPAPPILPHATIISLTNRTLNGRVRYKCQDGMAMDYGRDNLVCSSQGMSYYSHGQEMSDVQTGHWLNRYSNGYIGCYHIPRCPDPPSVPNAKADVTSVTKNGVATYRCSDEYEMNGNRSEFEIKCSRNGYWVFYNQKTGQMETGYEERIRHVCQCLKTPDCGSPPKVPHSTVNCTDTALNGTAVYTCKAGYRLVGSEFAICAKVDDDRLKRWIEWLFVPTCEPTCPAREGRRGNHTVARYQVSHCVLTEQDTLQTTLKCELPVTYSVKRVDLNKAAQDRRGQPGIFYGSDLCFSERSTAIRSFGDRVLYERKRCRSVCLQGASEVREIIIRDEFTSSPSLQHHHALGVSSTERKFTTTRQQTILRYDFLERK